MIGLGVEVYVMYVMMVEFINNVRGCNRTVPESFRTICYCFVCVITVGRWVGGFC